MAISELTNKRVVLFGANTISSAFINFLNENDVNVIILDADRFHIDVEKKDLISFSTRNKINWNEVDCLITNQDDKSLVDIAKKYECPVFSIIEFFENYFKEYNYIGVIGESGSSIASDLLKYLLCKIKLNIDYEICKKESLFSLSEFGKTNMYIFEIKQKMFNYLQSPHFNNIILFDLNYNKSDCDKIKDMFLNQTEEDFAILNIDDRNVKEFYINIKDDSNYKSMLIPISINKILKNGISFINNEIYLNIDDKNDEILTNEFKNLSGEQNKINILAVFALLLKYNIQPQEIVENLYNFIPCSDIFELVLHDDNFTFINDIKNNNKSQSLISFDNIYWILCVDEIDFEFDEFSKLAEYFKNIKYAFILGKYNEGLIETFRNNDVKYFIMYDMENTFKKIEEFAEDEKKEEKITILLSSINNMENSDFYSHCSEEFERFVNINEE